MKIASGIISLLFAVIIFFQSSVAYLGGSVFDEESTAQGGSVGILVALMYIIGGAFAFKLPKVAMVFSIIAGILGIAVGTTTPYKDMTVWGVIALILAVMEFFAGRKPQKVDKHA
jgi:hypothetical protein